MKQYLKVAMAVLLTGLTPLLISGCAGAHMHQALDLRIEACACDVHGGHLCIADLRLEHIEISRGIHGARQMKHPSGAQLGHHSRSGALFGQVNALVPHASRKLCCLAAPHPFFSGCQ